MANIQNPDTALSTAVENISQITAAVASGLRIDEMNEMKTRSIGAIRSPKKEIVRGERDKVVGANQHLITLESQRGSP